MTSEGLGPVRAVEALGNQTCRFPSSGGPAPEPALDDANRRAWAWSAAVVEELLPGVDLGRLVGSTTREECLLAEPGTAVTGPLLGLEDLDRFLTETLFPLDGDARTGWHPRVSEAGQRLPPAHHLHQDAWSAAGRGARVNTHALAAALRGGASLYLRNIAAHHLPLRRLLEHLRRVFGGGGHVGAFLGRGEAPAPYGVHWDQTENLCFQLVGNRRWQVRRPSIPDNHYALLAEDGEAGEIVWDGVLAAGQALYVPRAYWHEVTPVDDDLSLSVTVGLNRPVAHDALHWLLPRAAQDPALRAPLPHPQAGRADGLQPLRDAVAGASDEAFLAHLQARELPIAGGSIGVLGVLALDRPVDLVIRSQLTGAVTLADRGGDGFALAAGGRVLAIDPAYGELVATALSGPPVAVADLLRLGPDPDDGYRLVDALLRQDWCVPARLDEDPLARA